MWSQIIPSARCSQVTGSRADRNRVPEELYSVEVVDERVGEHKLQEKAVEEEERGRYRTGVQSQADRLTRRATKILS